MPYWPMYASQHTHTQHTNAIYPSIRWQMFIKRPLQYYYIPFGIVAYRMLLCSIEHNSLSFVSTAALACALLVEHGMPFIIYFSVAA